MNLREEVQNVLDKDPAARSELEVILCYPGLHAIVLHRLAHGLYRSKLFTTARVVSHFARWLTGIEIHPGATLGRRVFIDHGMGVVIGETAVVGDDSVIYQGVTLGAGAAARGGESTRGAKRHPTLGRNVVVGSGAEIQGDIVVGDNVQVASGSIVLKDVPPNSIVVGVPGRVIYRDGQRVTGQQVPPDIEAEAIKALKDKIIELERKVDALRAGAATGPVAKTAVQLEPEAGPAAPDAIDVFLHGAGI